MFLWQGTWENLWKTQINTDDIESDWLPKVQSITSIWTCCCWQAPRHPSLKSWRHQWESLTELLLSVKKLPEVKLFSTLCVIIWKYCDVNKLISYTRHLSHRWIKISWNESLNITGSQMGDVTVQPSFSDITANQGVFPLFPLTFSPGRPRPQNEEYLGAWAALRADGTQRIGVVPVFEPERALRWTPLQRADLRDDKWPQQHMNIWRLPGHPPT